MDRLLLALVAATTLAACGPGAGVPPDAAAVDPLDVLPACGEPPGPTVDAGVALVLPPGTLVLERTEQGPLTLLTAYVGMTPGDVRGWYEESADVQLLTSEDEIVEVELLFTDRVTRAYLKGVAQCRTGTALTIVVAAELEGAPDLVPDDAFGNGTG